MASSTRVRKDLAVADFACLGRFDDGGYSLLHNLIAKHDFQLDFWQQVDGIFPPAVKLRVALLAAVAARFQDRQTVDSNFQKCALHGIELGGLNHRFQFSHRSPWVPGSIRRC